MHVDAFVLARQLHTGNQRDAARVGVGFDLEKRGEIVVIADRDDLDPGRARDIDHLTRRAGAVGMMSMCVQVAVTQSATRTSKLS